MKKILIGLGIVLLILASWFYFKPKNFSGRTDGGDSSAVSISKSETATTSPTYFTAGTTASSTKIFNIEYFGKMAPSVCLNASTTASIFNWSVEYGDNTTAANTNWFRQSDYTESGNTRTWGAGIVYNTWTPGAAGITCAQLFDNEEFIGVRARVTYNVTGANGAVFLESLFK